MKPMNKCQVCGKAVQGSLMCEDCESEVLEMQKGRGYLLSGLLGIVFIAVLFLLWKGYRENQSQIDLGIVTGGLGRFMETVSAFLASPYILIPTVIFFIIIAFLVGVKLSK